jgi:nucleotide-binding universal stress UspA family protein
MAVQRLLVATDLSARSERAIGRAALLARQFRAELILLHVVDDDQPPPLVAAARRQAEKLLRAAAPDLGGPGPEILVGAGDPFEVVAQTAEERVVDLVVMGAHRKRILRDVFTGTTIERVMRTGRHPVLMVNRPPAGPYRTAVVASDLSEASAGALRTAASLAFLGASELSIVHAFTPLAKDMMAYAGIEREKIEEHVTHANADARNKLIAFLRDCCPELQEHPLLVEEGEPVEVIGRAVTRTDAELAVIGTRGHTGLKRVLLGSIADEALRTLECDVLAVGSTAQEPAVPAGADGPRFRRPI